MCCFVLRREFVGRVVFAIRGAGRSRCCGSFLTEVFPPDEEVLGLLVEAVLVRARGRELRRRCGCGGGFLEKVLREMR